MGFLEGWIHQRADEVLENVQERVGEHAVVVGKFEELEVEEAPVYAGVVDSESVEPAVEIQFLADAVHAPPGPDVDADGDAGVDDAAGVDVVLEEIVVDQHVVLEPCFVVRVVLPQTGFEIRVCFP